MTSPAEHALPSHGQLCYLQIPTLNIDKSAEFYAAIFGWQTSPGESGFEAPGLIGQFIDDRPVDPEAGLLAWIWVYDIRETLARATELGSLVLSPPAVDGGERWLATITDPGGNQLGVVSAVRA